MLVGIAWAGSAPCFGSGSAFCGAAPSSALLLHRPDVGESSTLKDWWWVVLAGGEFWAPSWAAHRGPGRVVGAAFLPAHQAVRGFLIFSGLLSARGCSRRAWPLGRCRARRRALLAVPTFCQVFLEGDAASSSSPTSGCLEILAATRAVVSRPAAFFGIGSYTPPCAAPRGLSPWSACSRACCWRPAWPLEGLSFRTSRGPYFSSSPAFARCFECDGDPVVGAPGPRAPANHSSSCLRHSCPLLRHR